MKKINKIGKDDVIILNEELLPKLVRPHEFHNLDDFTTKTDYKVIGITWELFPDKTRTLAYILINEKNILVSEIASHFVVIE